MAESKEIKELIKDLTGGNMFDRPRAVARLIKLQDTQAVPALERALRRKAKNLGMGYTIRHEVSEAAEEALVGLGATDALERFKQEKNRQGV